MDPVATLATARDSGADHDPLGWRATARNLARFDRVMRAADIHPVTKETPTMHTGTTRQLTNLLDQQRRLEERIAKLTEHIATYGTEDPYDVGSIVV